MSDDWVVNASDDEWNSYNDKTYAQNEFFIPERLIKLYPEIHNKKVLPLYNCYCPRKGKEPVRESPQPPQTQISPQKSPGNEKPTIEKNKEENPEINKTFEAFEFDDDEEKPSTKRKPPGSAKRSKRDKEKVGGSMSNVLNDMRRSKMLDELEAKKNEQDITTTKEESETNG